MRSIAALLLTCATLVACAPPPEPAAPKIGAIPLPALIDAFLLLEGTSPDWAMGATERTPQLHWNSVGVQTTGCGSFRSCRQGSARVSVSGVELQNLRQRVEPVRWSLFMTSTEIEKFGPQQLHVRPMCDTVSCEFDFERGMQASAIGLQKLCDAGPPDFRQTAYFLTHGNRHAVAVVGHHLGSGGASTDLTIIFATDALAQDWCAEARSSELSFVPNDVEVPAPAYAGARAISPANEPT